MLVPSGAIGVEFYEAFIVQYLPTGEIILSSGGYKTRSTQVRLNEFSPFTIEGKCETRRQDAGDWEVFTPNDSARFIDRMTIPFGGSLQNHKQRIFEKGASL
jgi:hypothetical protein